MAQIVVMEDDAGTRMLIARAKERTRKPIRSDWSVD
jgi:hypothetical protein